MELEGKRAGHVVLGGGVLGLSAAWRLAEQGADVLVLEKGLIGSGASGAAGGIVRNYYRSPAITRIIKASVDIFEAEADEFGFRQVGYVAAVPPAQVEDLIAIREQHESAGYESELIVGADDCRTYLEFVWPDFQAPVAALLHERRGGWADPMQTIRHLASHAREAGATIAEEVEVDWVRGGGRGRRGDRDLGRDRVLRDARGRRPAPGSSRSGASSASGPSSPLPARRRSRWSPT